MLIEPEVREKKSSNDDALTNIGWLMSTSVPLATTTPGQPTPPSTPPVTSSESSQSREASPKVDYANQSTKPPFSYSQMITMAMKAHGGDKVVLNDIYEWIRVHFAFYRQGDTSWQNSIRHNLSLNKQFIKVPRDDADKGKGSYWRLDMSSKDPYCIRRRNFVEAGLKRSDKPQVNKPQVNPAIKSFLRKSSMNVGSMAPVATKVNSTISGVGTVPVPQNGAPSSLIPTEITYKTTYSNDLLPSQGAPIYNAPVSSSLYDSNRVKVEYNWEAYEYQPNSQVVGVQLPIQLSQANSHKNVQASSVGLSPSSSEETDASGSGLELRIPTPEWWGNQVTSASLLSPQNSCQNYLARVFENMNSTSTTKTSLPAAVNQQNASKSHPWQDKLTTNGSNSIIQQMIATAPTVATGITSAAEPLFLMADTVTEPVMIQRAMPSNGRLGLPSFVE